MPSIYTTNSAGKLTGILTYSHAYQYMGFRFEVHRYLGPSKLNKDGEPSVATGRKFWAAWDAWNKLTDEEKAKTRI